MSQHYMTYSERLKLEALYNAGFTVAKIAVQLGFCRTTIYNEIKLGKHEALDEEYRTVIRYSADIAQKVHDYNQTNKGCPLKIGNDHSFAAFIEQQIIEEKASPAVALARARAKGFKTEISVNTLYRYIDQELFQKLRNKHLWRKGKRHKGREKLTRVVHPRWPSIEERPQTISTRDEYGHWEKDLIVGKKGTNACLLTLTERKSRQEKIFKLPNKQASTIRKVFDRLERETANFNDMFKTFTTDNGSEFLQYEELTKSVHGGKRFEVYYCHSYSAWEKGTNENHNGIIRRFFPKGTDFTTVSEEQIQSVEDWMNNYPRKILGWRTPNEAAAAPAG